METFKIKRTHIQSVRDTNAAQLAEVCRLLRWTELQYCRHQFSEYQEMIVELGRVLPAARVRKIEYSPVFRGFFNNEWEMRNQLYFFPFVQDYSYLPLMAWEDEYRHQHDHMILLDDYGFRDKLQYILNLI